MMETTPKSLRLPIGIFGRTNVGKSSFLNMISGQSVAITSAIPGTTTDAVEKPMELLPLGPVVFFDTAGIDDQSALGELRVEKALGILDRVEIVVLIVEPNVWTSFEKDIIRSAAKRKLPCLIVVNKVDAETPQAAFIRKIEGASKYVMYCAAIDIDRRETYLNTFKKLLIDSCPEEALRQPSLIGDLLPAGGMAVLVVPIDLQAPKGRLILPQVQTIRDALDNDASVMIVKEREYAHVLSLLKAPPNIVVCDSQVVMKMIADTPREVSCTTFSILFARFKGDIIEAARGAATLERIGPGDKVLVAEACSHHALEDDIGRVKIPRWLRQFAGADVGIDVYSGHDYPVNLEEYKLVVHCGGCMLARREMLVRITKAREAGVPITNYGVCISVLQGVVERVLSPFPAALDAYQRAIIKIRTEVKNGSTDNACYGMDK
jgi:[FeFe] hydrogenase H-cluster maturation GTPase HydF